jgi:hypothetical protein
MENVEISHILNKYAELLELQGVAASSMLSPIDSI